MKEPVFEDSYSAVLFGLIILVISAVLITDGIISYLGG